MEESVTYQAIIRKGEARGELKGKRATILLVGTERFGPPADEVAEKLNKITDPARLDEIALRLPKVDSWQELLAEPAKSKVRRRRK